MNRLGRKVPEICRAMDQRFALLIRTTAILFSASGVLASPAVVEDSLPIGMLPPIEMAVSASQLASICEADVDELRTRIERLSVLEAEHIPPEYLTSVDTIFASQQGRWMFALTLAFVHPDETTANIARGCAEAFKSIETELFSSAEIFGRLMSVDLPRATPEARRAIDLLANRFRAAGVGFPGESRERAIKIQEEIDSLGLQFIENIRAADSVIEVPRDRLGGLPDKYIESRYDDERDLVRISGRSDDSQPVLRFAEDAQLRFEVLRLSKLRGYPENRPILHRMLILRQELAELSGYSHFAQLDMQGTMAGSPDRVAAYIQTLSELVFDAARREANFLATLKNDDEQGLAEWDVSYLVSNAQDALGVVSADVLRRYFPFDQTSNRVFRFVGSLLGIDFRRIDVEGWHKEIKAYEVLVGGEPRGTILMDMHPREGKIDGNQAVVLQVGIADRSMPIIALLCNFPRGNDGLEITQVRTLLHEFGHAVHFVLSGNQKFGITSSIGIEFDFLEAPSQLLELFLDEYDTIRLLATSSSHTELPNDILNDLAVSDHLGTSLEMQRQLYFADLSLRLHYNFDSSRNLDEINAEIERENRPLVALVPGAQKYASFGHLYGYRSRFYAYDWSLAIAADLYSEFRGNREPAEIGVDYRRKVLEQGASVPIDTALEEFLGRPVSFRTFGDQLADRQRSLFERIED